MLPGVRIDWDRDLPLVASQAFDAGGRSFRDGDPFPWRELELDEHSVVAMWRCGMVNHPQPATVVEFRDVTPGELVHVETPKQKRQRTARAAAPQE